MGLLGKKKRRTVSVPVASMGDIAFLLIIFFLVCSEESKEKKIDAVIPKSVYVEKIKANVAVRISIDKDGAIYFDGHPVDGPKDVEVGVRAALTRTISDDQRHVQFKCHAGHTREVFEPVMQAIAEAGGIIEAVGEKQQ